MSKYAAFQCWILFVAQFIFHENAAMGILSDRDRVLVTYNPTTDRCYALTPHSNTDAKEGANKACEEAFFALDRLEGNSCNGWRYPKCRQLYLPESDHFQCSCKITHCSTYEIRADAIAFKDCAWKVHAEELFYGVQTPSPSPRFQNTQQRIFDQAVQRSRHRHQGSSSSGAGTSNVARVSPLAGTSSTPGIDCGPYKCGDCGRHYATQQILKDHKPSHEMEIRCKECKTTFSTKGNLTLHNKRRHPEEVKEPQGDFVCGVCGKRYRSRASLITHGLTHREEVRCYICKRDFARKFGLQRHMENFHPEIATAETENELKMRKPFECEECKARFASKKMLGEHKAVHRGETYCPFCNRNFSRRHALFVHLEKQHP